jgi:hypothetical protein
MRILLALFALLTLPLLASAEEPAVAPKVKLVVHVVFDQLRGDLIDKWQPHFGEGGFKRLQTEGAWFKNCHYPYAITTTGPGHASMLTGATPSKTGIVNNEWYDRAKAANVYCAGSDRYDLIPAAIPEKVVEGDAQKPPVKKKAVGDPDRLLSPTLGDVLKERGAGKVFGLSLKDRSAIFPSGHKADGAYWFNGRFVTSTYYRDSPHKWADDFNKSKAADAYFGRDWTKFRPELDYGKFAGPDDGAGEGKGVGEGVKFPHPIDGGLKAVGAGYYDALATSPFGNELLLDFAKVCIDAEKLGQRDAADLLTVSFSSNDLIGHTWGPDSQEVFDVTLRSDAIVESLLKYLDAKVGVGKYAVMLTADHGICPLPEFAAKQGKDAKRISAAKLVLGCEGFLREKYGEIEESESDPKEKTPTRYLEAVVPPYLYLNHRLLASKKLKSEDVAEALAGYLRKQEGILQVYSHAGLKAGLVGDDAISRRVLRSFHAERSGDLYIVLKPYHLVGNVTVNDKLATGTTHGSPHEYDTHVPLLVYGPGIAGGARDEAVTPLHSAAIGADFLGVKPPKDAEYGLPKTLKRK